VLIEAEDVSPVKADTLKNAVTIEQAVIKHGDLGFRLVYKMPIEVNFHLGTA
jgi:hypothetical protein